MTLKFQVYTCSKTVLQITNTHPIESAKESELIFTNFLNKTSHSNSSTQATDSDKRNDGRSSAMSTTFKPRIIPLDFCLPDLGQACTTYCLQPSKFDFHELPRSCRFALSVCSSLVETDTKTLHNCVKHLETQISRQLTFIRNIEKEYGEDKDK